MLLKTAIDVEQLLNCGAKKTPPYSVVFASDDTGDNRSNRHSTPTAYRELYQGPLCPSTPRPANQRPRCSHAGRLLA